MTNAWDTSSGDSVIFDQPLYKGEIKSNSFSVTHENKNILTITSEGNLILGESFTKDEAAEEFAKILLKVWKKNNIPTDLIEKAEKVRASLQDGIAFQGVRSCYELDSETTTKRMDQGANIITELLEYIESFN